MALEAVLGCVVVAGALVANIGLVVWGRRIIERIHARRLLTARDIVRDLKHGR